MVKMNGCAAADSTRLFHFWVDKAAVAADFHLGNGTCYIEKMRNGKHSRCMYTLHFLPKSSNPILAKILIFRFACSDANIRSKQGTAVPTHANLLGKHPKPFNNFREIGCAPAELKNEKF